MVVSERVGEPVSDEIGTIVVLSGGFFDEMNPIEVRDRMDQLAAYSGLEFNVLPGQSKPHIHQAKWRQVCAALENAASPLVLVGHSNGGAAALNIARCLEAKGRPVDLLATCDSVPTPDDNGSSRIVPVNVRMNLNAHVIPTRSWILLPFPFGERNLRPDGSQEGILNVGLAYDLNGMLAHRNAFYDLTGGDGFRFPRLLIEVVRAVLRGASFEEVRRVVATALQELARQAPVRVDMKNPSPMEIDE